MGELKARAHADAAQQRAFVLSLLQDLEALGRMLEEGRIESDVHRIGVEQELFLVDEALRAAPVVMDVLRTLDDPRFTTELAAFNLEANLAPRKFGGDCLRSLEQDLESIVDTARQAAAQSGAEVFLTGILPTLQASDVSLDRLTPMPRYRALNDAVVKLRGDDYLVRIHGIDEYFCTTDNVMLEGANTSFQVHFQVSPESFARYYNFTQAAAGPVLAAAVNSPLLFEHRLWQETRIALFQHSVDDRSSAQRHRGRRPRVRFGEGWVHGSAVDLFREDIARFRVVLAVDLEQSALDVLDKGEVPDLAALCLHNGTVYRWNRPCYGVHAGRPHLRIENRMLPAGPTILDEVANAAFFYGVVAGLAERYEDITREMSFDVARKNFAAAARYGLKAPLDWLEGVSGEAAVVLLDAVLPLAHEGLASAGIDDKDVVRYLGVIEERVRTGQTGAQWTLDSLNGLPTTLSMHERSRMVTAAALARQREGRPVHTWKLASPRSGSHGPANATTTVESFMTRDLFTVQPDDVVDLATNVMAWRHIRHVPVEDAHGNLLGLLSHRDLLAHMSHRRPDAPPVPVSQIMSHDPIVVTPETTAEDAVELMRAHDVGCLPVVREGKLVGIVSERDFLELARRILSERVLAGL